MLSRRSGVLNTWRRYILTCFKLVRANHGLQSNQYGLVASCSTPSSGDKGRLTLYFRPCYGMGMTGSSAAYINNEHNFFVSLEVLVLPWE